MKRRTLKKLAALMAGAMVLTAMPFADFNTTKAEAEPYLCPFPAKYELIENGSFIFGEAAPWKLDVANSAKAVGKVERGAYKVTVDKTGDNDKDRRWAVTLKQEDLTLENGHTYDVSFTVKADHDCMVYPTIGDDGYPYNEYWNCLGNGQDSRTWVPIALKAGEAKTVHGSFKMEQTVRKCCMKFEMSGDCAPKDLGEGEQYSYTFSNISVRG